MAISSCKERCAAVVALLVTFLCVLAVPVAGAAEQLPPPPGERAADVLEVAVYDEAPFGYQPVDGAVSGLMVEVWEEIARQLGVEYRYTLTDMEGLLAGLEAGRFDVGLGAITITPAREVRVDFSQAVTRSGTGIAVSRTRAEGRFEAYLLPISAAILKLAGALLLVLLTAGAIVWLVERNHDRDPGYRDIDTLEDGLWWSAVTISTIGYGDKVPRTRLGRAVGVLWIFASLVLLSLFTANASAIFTATRVESHIRSEDDLRRVRVGAAELSSGAEYCTRERIDFRAYPDVRDAIDALLVGEIDAVVSNAPVLRYLNNFAYQRRMLIPEQRLAENNMGIALAEDSPLREDLDRVLLRMLAEPEWSNALERYLGPE